MQIFIRDLSGSTLVYEVDQGTNASDLFQLVNDRTGIPCDQQRLVCSGKDISSSLSSSWICTHDQTYDLSLRVIGGVKNPSHIKNKLKRNEVYAKYKNEKKVIKKKLRAERVKEIEALGDAAPPKQIPRTIENTREEEETMVKSDDAEVLGDEADDEFAKYFLNETNPKIMITTRPKASRKLYPFIGDLMQMIPQAFYYPRKNQTIKEMCKDAYDKKFTHLIMLAEKQKQCNGLLVTHLPEGPTAFFKLSSFEEGSKIKGHGKPTSHIPELIMNNFGTRLGRRTARVLGSLFPHEPQLEGRQVVTFHNQRDFIFVRHHRYIYRKESEKTRARLQELGLFDFSVSYTSFLNSFFKLLFYNISTIFCSLSY